MDIAAIIKDHWAVIQADPATFVTFAIVFGGAGFAFGRFAYSGAMTTRDERIAHRDETIAALQKQLLARPVEAARNPDAVYQYGALVANVAGARIDLGAGEVYFAGIEGKGAFNSKVEFEFRDLRLMIASASPSSSFSIGGFKQTEILHDVRAKIVGKIG